MLNHVHIKMTARLPIPMKTAPDFAMQGAAA